MYSMDEKCLSTSADESSTCTSYLVSTKILQGSMHLRYMKEGSVPFMFRCLLGFLIFRPGPWPSHKAYIGVSSNVPLKLPDAIMSVQSSGVREEW